METGALLSGLSPLPAQIGNLIAFAEGKGPGFSGIAELFFSSLIQFQPLAEIELLAAGGEPVPLVLQGRESSLARTRKLFSGGGFLLEQEAVVCGDTLVLRLGLRREAPAAGGLGVGEGPSRLRISGACLFSPQGVPYHWQEEKRLEAVFRRGRRLELTWQDRVLLTLSFSPPFTHWGLAPLAEERVLKEPIFSSFNLKKRWAYWVEREDRLAAPGQAEGGIAARNAVYWGELEVRDAQGFALQMALSAELLPCPESSEGPPRGRSAGRTPGPRPELSALKRKKEKQWESFLAGVPRLETPHQDLLRAYTASWHTLFANRLVPGLERLRHPFTSVNKFHYYNQFFWDSAFHALSWLWHNSPEQAESELKNFALNQWRCGMIPHELFLFPVNGREWMDTEFLSSAVTQPPVIAVALPEVFRKYGNLSFLEFFYQPLLRYEEWLWRCRDLGRRGLSCFTHIWETGWDNSPRFDGVARNRLLDPWLEGVDFNVFVYLLRQALVEMAGLLGRRPPAGLRERLELTRQGMNRFMWDGREGFYFDLVAGGREKIRVKTAAGLLPLMTDIPDQGRRRRLIRSHLLCEGEFLTPCPVPSVSRSEPSFGSADFWRGATWPQITWCLLYGLKERDPEPSSLLLDRFLSATAGETSCNEYYDSLSGKGAGLPLQGWGTLFIDLILRHLLGIEPRAGGFRFRPLRTRYTRLRVDNLRLQGFGLEAERKGENWLFVLDGRIRLELAATQPFSCLKRGDGFHLRFTEPLDRAAIAVHGNRSQRWRGKDLLILE